jgi:hypothetical protein
VHSDGSLGYHDFIAAAKTVGLDFLAFTDHMTLGGKNTFGEGFRSGVFVLIGYEHNDADNRNHYLVFNVDRTASDAASVQRYIDEVKEMGGIGFIAHPFERRHYFADFPPYPWTAWDAQGFDGIELWNQMSEWMEKIKTVFSVVKFMYPRRFISNVSGELLKTWDNLNRRRYVSGIGGVDAHTKRLRSGFLGYTVFPIKVELKGIRTHCLFTEDISRCDENHARRLLIDALKNGHGFVSNYRRGDARGTRISLSAADGLPVLPGNYERTTTLPATLMVSLPDIAEINLLRNGTLVEKRHARDASIPISATGVYRLEIYKNKHAWIYSNPFPVGSYPF